MATSPIMPNPPYALNGFVGRCFYKLARRWIRFQCNNRGKQFPSRLPVRLLQLSADKGNLKAMSELGEMLFSNGACRADKRSGLEYLRRAAKLGDGQAQFALAEAHMYGTPLVRPNRQTAAHWYALAAGQGHECAVQRLQVLRDNGQF